MKYTETAHRTDISLLLQRHWVCAKTEGNDPKARRETQARSFLTAARALLEAAAVLII